MPSLASPNATHSNPLLQETWSEHADIVLLSSEPRVPGASQREARTLLPTPTSLTPGLQRGNGDPERDGSLRESVGDTASSLARVHTRAHTQAVNWTRGAG